MIEIIPTSVPRSREDLLERIGIIRRFTNRIHIDADDGVFTPMICWPYTAPRIFGEVTLSGLDGMDVEVHLMVQEPHEIGNAFARAGAATMVGHIEAFGSADSVRAAMEDWRVNGAREVGLALLFNTPVSSIDSFADECDVVQLMSSPIIGAQGAMFESATVDHVAELHARHPHLTISVDIGVSEDTIGPLVRAGATRFAAGSAIMKTEDPKAAYENLKQIAEGAVNS